MPALEVFLDMGRDVLERAEKIVAAPMFVCRVKADRAVGNRDIKLYLKLAAETSKSWYHCFRAILNIPHNAMIPCRG